jgi:hypothetical protein
LAIDKKNPDSVTKKAEDICAGIDGHPALFVDPNPLTSVIKAQIVVVNEAKVLARTRAHGTAKARDVQVGVLVGLLETACNYVQGRADKCSTPEEAAATIEAAGLTVALVGKRTKAILEVTKGPTPGSANLEANATALGADGKKKTFFNWESTLDGKVFVSLPSTPKCKTSVANLTPLTTVGFRVSVTNSTGIAGPWTDVVYLLIR